MLPSGTVTFLFTDIEGSSVLWDRSPALMSVVLARHDEILKHAIADAGGHVFASGGDGFAAAFRSVGEALSAATSAQVQIASQEWPQAAVIRVRVGIHTGVADEREGNYFGATVSRAARICAAAAGGQVALSSLSAQLAAGDRWELVEAGTFRLTGFERPEALSRLIVPGVLDVDRPFRGALDRTVGNLRRPRGELVGREVEVDELARQLGAPGLTTLVGPGGVGKTRLALAAALVASEGFADGAWLVELAALSSPNDLVQATASALGIQLTGHQLSAVSIASALATQQRLIVLDNCEHVVDAAAELADALMTVCPAITLVATSREALAIDGERVVRVGPLKSVSNIGLSPAARLFCERLQPTIGRELSNDEVVTIEDICARLDGLPLGIELAAARVRAFGLYDVQRRLDDVLRVRTRHRGDERHQSLQATVAWSYALLTDDERLVFDRLSVFVGSFDLDAATAVAGGSMQGGRVDEHIASLVDKSLLTLSTESGPARYTLLETIRQYGGEQLRARDEWSAIRQLHLTHFVEFIERADTGIRGPHELQWHRAIGDDFANVRGAFRWAIETSDIDAASRLVWHLHRWSTTRLCMEVGAWAAAVLELETARDHPAAPIVVATAATFAESRTDWRRARALVADALALEEAHGFAPEPWVADVANHLDQPRRAATFGASLGQLRRRAHGDEFWELIADGRENGRLTVQLFDPLSPTEAVGPVLDRLRACVDRAERFGNPTLIARAIGNLGIGLRRFAPDEALDPLERAIEMGAALDLRRLVSDYSQDVAMVLARLGRPTDALLVMRPLIVGHRRSGSITSAWLNTVAVLPALQQLGHSGLVCRHLGLFDATLGKASHLGHVFIAEDMRVHVDRELGTVEAARLLAEGEHMTFATAIEQCLVAITETVG